MNKQDVLLLYHRLPYPPNKGEKMRAWQQVSYLSARHRVWLACFVDDPADCEHVSHLQDICYRVAALPLNKRIALSRGGWRLIRGGTLTEGYYGSGAMWQVLQSWQSEVFFDVAMAFSSSMASYIEDMPVGRRVLDMNDFDSHKWSNYADRSNWPLSALYRTEARRLSAREHELVSKFDLTLMVNERECDRLDDPVLRNKVQSFRTPVSVDSYADVWGVHHDKVIGYTGTMDYRPNVEAVLWFAEHVWPIVKEQHPDAQWWIVGRNPTAVVKRLADDPHIKVTGFVDNIRDYLRRMRVYVAPVQTEIGVQTKVLEAFAAGRAIVMTPQGHDGISGDIGADYLVAQSSQAFAASVGQLLDDRDRCERLGRSAIDLARRRYDAAVLMPDFESLLVGEMTANNPQRVIESTS